MCQHCARRDLIRDLILHTETPYAKMIGGGGGGGGRGDLAARGLQRSAMIRGCFGDSGILNAIEEMTG